MFISYEKHNVDDDFNQKCIILYTHGCNLRCPYCFNPHLVTQPKQFSLSEKMVLEFLAKNKQEYEWIVLTGGEPTIHDKIFEYGTKFKELGYKIELCSNGTNTSVIRLLLQLGYIDKYRIDYKCPPEKHKKFGFKTFTEYENVLHTIELLTNVYCSASGDFELEIRTTLHQNLITNDDLDEMVCELLPIIQYTDITYSILYYDDSVETIGKLPAFNESYYNFNEISKKFNNFKICSVRN